MQIYAFSNVLSHLRRPLQVNNLAIDLAAYTWRHNCQVKAFCSALKNVTVHKSVTVTGLDVHLELELRQLAMALWMNPQPIGYDVSFRTAECQKLGHFKSTYVRAQSVDDLKVPKGKMIEDPISKYGEWIQTATQACYVNGLDYVTDVGYFTY